MRANQANRHDIASQSSNSDPDRIEVRLTILQLVKLSPQKSFEAITLPPLNMTVRLKVLPHSRTAKD